MLNAKPPAAATRMAGASRPLPDRLIAACSDRAVLEREALGQAREILRQLMTPGRRFPRREKLLSAWRVFRQLDALDASDRAQPGR